MSLATFSSSGTPYAFVDAAALVGPERWARLPWVKRIVLENLLRAATKDYSAEALIAGLLAPASAGEFEMPLSVSRVILPDSSGIPVLMGLAALRATVSRKGGDPAQISAKVPIDFIVDHSLQVDTFGSRAALGTNLAREYARNAERYAFLKWAQGAFDGLRVYPPGSGIIHQLNIEQIASVTALDRSQDLPLAFPDFCIGGDSHTTMVNAIGVLGWGVGGIEAETAVLGQYYMMPRPDFVGVRLSGQTRPGVTMTDVALTLTQHLRAQSVVGSFLEFFGPGAMSLSVPDRATLANMAPEYGATTGFWPVDAKTLDYLRLTGRSPEQVALVEDHTKAAGLFRAEAAPQMDYDRVIDFDLGRVARSVAGPGKPHLRKEIAEIAQSFFAHVGAEPAGPEPAAATPAGSEPKGGAPVKGAPESGAPASQAPVSHEPVSHEPVSHEPVSQAPFSQVPASQLPLSQAPARLADGAIAIAAITSCTNTANPEGMIRAGLLARAAAARGLVPPSWVKTSFAPGSHATTRYLTEAGLMADLEALGFHVIGYGCTTCGGKSGSLTDEMVRAVTEDGVKVAAVLSGNRNFDGRIHRLVPANYLCSPALVIAYALAGSILTDLDRAPLGRDAAGAPVYLADLWPSDADVARTIQTYVTRAAFAPETAQNGGDSHDWAAIPAQSGPLFDWAPASFYIKEPPFFDTGDQAAFADQIRGARVLGLFGDGLTTDHMSPSGEIPKDSPAGQYLQEQGIAPKDFNTYVGRRGNHHVMTRGTFANLRLQNRLVPERQGWWTRAFPEGDLVSFYEASRRYQARGAPAIILAGQDYGQGSSRDWAAKGQALLGVKAVIAGSFERIHRANLIGMGILPLRFLTGQSIESLGLQGDEEFDLSGLQAALESGRAICVRARPPAPPPARAEITFEVEADLRTENELRLIRGGGIYAIAARSA